MIEKIVAGLSEVYQPVYGHPELSEHVSRMSEDRLEAILETYDALQNLLSRPLKILDLGCAQGFFSFSLAERGAIVHGVDYLDENITLCKMLAQKNPHLQVYFECGLVEEAVSQLEDGQFDIVLGLSVFHHIVYEKGIDAVKNMIERLAQQSGTLILELALHDEPLYWAAAQPESPVGLLGSIKFVHEYGDYETHLSSITRPLFIVSNQYFIVDNTAAEFLHVKSEPHSLANDSYQSSRYYFFGDGFIGKQYKFCGNLEEVNRVDFANMKYFLQKPPEGFPAPRMIASTVNSNSGLIMMERLPGRLLLDLLKENISFDKKNVLLSVLKQLATLEAAGFYHNDLRAWNVLVDKDGLTHLIDYDSIVYDKIDCFFPENLFLSFFIFSRELMSGIVNNSSLRTPIFLPFKKLPTYYYNWESQFWNQPVCDLSFGLLYNEFKKLSGQDQEEELDDIKSLLMIASDESKSRQRLEGNQLVKTVEKLEKKLMDAENIASTSKDQLVELQNYVLVVEKTLEESKANCLDLTNSISWRSTKPFRNLKKLTLKNWKKVFSKYQLYFLNLNSSSVKHKYVPLIMEYCFRALKNTVFLLSNFQLGNIRLRILSKIKEFIAKYPKLKIWIKKILLKYPRFRHLINGKNETHGSDRNDIDFLSFSVSNIVQEDNKTIIQSDFNSKLIKASTSWPLRERIGE